jgi:hypothetical protein
MRKALAPIPIALLFAALLFCGCTREPSKASASRAAVLRSNQEAMRLYHIEPFKEEHGQWRAEGQRSIWAALTSSGTYDVQAKVTFDEKEHVVSVDVRMLTHPDSKPSTKPDQVSDHPDMHQEKRLGIPEVMPK